MKNKTDKTLSGPNRERNAIPLFQVQNFLNIFGSKWLQDAIIAMKRLYMLLQQLFVRSFNYYIMITNIDENLFALNCYLDVAIIFLAEK